MKLSERMAIAKLENIETSTQGGGNPDKYGLGSLNSKNFKRAIQDVASSIEYAADAGDWDEDLDKNGLLKVIKELKEAVLKLEDSVKER